MVINGNGPPGIYNSSTTPDGSYGEYNWCAMPHVRKSEYKAPSSDYTLQYLEVIQRHNKRTPYASNTFFKEDIPVCLEPQTSLAPPELTRDAQWDCTGEGPYAYAKDKSQFNTTPVYWQAERNTQNPFEYTVGPGFINSTCQFPAITSEGLEDSKVHGEDLQGVYGGMLKFLPLESEREKYQWRVTNNPITSQTLSETISTRSRNLSDLDRRIREGHLPRHRRVFCVSCVLEQSGHEADTMDSRLIQVTLLSRLL